jgi:type IV secretion system protein VirD4
MITIKLRAILATLIASFLTDLFGFWRHELRFEFLGVAGLALPLAMLALVPSRRLPAHRIRHHRMRLRLRLHPGRGQATLFELWLRWGRWASYRRSRSLTRSVQASTHSVKLGRAHYGHGLRVPLEEHLLILAPPRTFKTALLADMILRYPGPVVSTTTKHDVFELTSGVRADCLPLGFFRRVFRGYRSAAGPIAVFNPQLIGGVPCTFRWNPIRGCEDPATAIRRADAFAYSVSMQGTEDGSFWSQKASSNLRSIFYAAALIGGDFRLVLRWALGSAEQAEEILTEAGAATWAAELRELRGAAEKTSATIRMVMSRCLSFMADPALAQSVLMADDDPGLDMEQFIRDRGTLYMIASGQGEDSPVAPLFACLANEMHYTATLLGSREPSGRLDPPMGFFGDEIAQVCPIPLPTMLADSGGKGVQMVTVAHGEAQLRTRWRSDGAQAILDTSGVKVFLPGITDDDTLLMASRLCGQTAYRERGQDGHSRHDVLTPDMIRSLPAGWGLVIRAGLAPVVVKLSICWKDRLYKRAKRAGTAIAPVVAAPPVDIAGMGFPVLAESLAGELAEVSSVTSGDTTVTLGPAREAEPVTVPWRQS